MRYQFFTKGFFVLLAGLLVAGCAARQENAMLEDAKAAYSAARTDPQVVANAPTQLNQAVRNLEQAESLYEENAPEDRVTHQAYLARQKVAIAREAAQLAAAQEAIASTEAQRHEVLLAARSREAERARQLAEARQKELEEVQLQARQQAGEAEQARLQAQAQQQDELEQLRQEIEGLQAEQTSRGLVLTLQDIVFEFDEAKLNPGSERTIGKIAEFLKEHPERTVAVEGFTDAVGPEEYNEKLSQERADSVRQALVRQGVDPERIISRGYGEKYPVASNESPAGRQLNRRVEIIISNGGEQVSMQ